MHLTIDNKPIDLEPGTTILEAAGRVGIDIPTLCHQPGKAPRTSCFVCVVKIEGSDNFTPACTAKCAEGMVVHSSTPEVAATRKTALELLLSDHAGACVASCSMGCPADLDIPAFIRPMTQGDLGAANAVIYRRLPLPATLGHICPGYCESACIRKKMDEAVWVRTLHRIAAEENLASSDPFVPARKPASGKCVAIVGAGPAGLSAAFFLLQEGHDCLIFDVAEKAGGLLRGMSEEKLPKAVLDAEIALIQKMGAEFKFNWRLGRDGSLEELRAEFDAVVLACGAGVNPGTEQRKVDLEWVKELGIKAGAKGIAVERHTQATSLPGVFAAGETAAGAGTMIWAVATGRLAAVAINQYFKGEALSGPEKQIYFRKQVSEEEERLLYGGLEKTKNALGGDRGAPAERAPVEAARCLQCGCASRDDCKLRLYATRYGANFNRFRGERRELNADASHPEIVYEPGKCILCGICLRIAEEAGEEQGLCFVGRGFTTRMSVALGGEMARGLAKSARECATACPTGALLIKE